MLGSRLSVHVVIGVDPENRMYLLDLWRGQTSSDIWIEAWCDLVKKWRPSFWAEEHGQIISGVGPFLERRAIERHAYAPLTSGYNSLVGGSNPPGPTTQSGVCGEFL
jgi:hypothetical protein